MTPLDRRLILTRRAILAAMALGAAGCGGGSGSSGPSGSGGSGGDSAAGGALTVATADDVKSLDPALAYDTWSTAVVHACTRRLVDYDAEGKLVPDLAEKWNTSPDGRTWTFSLLQGAKFADGTAIEGKHFVAALERLRDPKTASPGADFYSGIASVESPSPQILIVKLKAPDPTLLNVLGMTFASPYLPGQGDPGAVLPVSSGPYVVEGYQGGTEVALKRNPQYQGPGAGAERILVQLNVPESLQLTRFQAGEVDLLPAVPPAEYTRVFNDPAEQDNLAQGVVNQTWYFGMNTRKAPWDNPKVRRAALLALDRQRHVQIAGPGQLANGILPPHVPGYKADRALPDQDLDAAKKLLAEAGFPGGVPKELETTLWLSGTDQNLRHAEAIAADLRAAGIPVRLRPLSLSQFLTAYRNEADCWYNGWYPDFPDAGNFMEPVFHGRNVGKGKNNAARYDNPKVNALLDRAHTMPDGPERHALYTQAEDLLLQDLPWIPLYFEKESRYFRDGVKGVTVHPVWRQMLTGITKG